MYCHKLRKTLLLFLFIFPFMAWPQQDTSSGGFSVLLEPVLGYTKQTLTGSNTENGTSGSILFGSRLGGQYIGIQTGIDYRVATGNFITTAGARSYEYDQTGFGFFLGYATPFYVRPYLVLQRTTRAIIIPNNTVRELKGKGMVYGVSLWLAVCSISVEYVNTKWTGLVEGATSTTLTDTKSKGINVVLSWPFVF